MKTGTKQWEEHLVTSMKQVLKKERFEHTMGVMYTAQCLAMRYGVSLYEAKIAGLLHDCAKYVSHKEKISLIKEHHLSISATEMDNPGLLHAKAGAIIAKEKYQVENPRILHAIAVHTTGCPDMSILDKIIFIADYIEPSRCEAPHLDKIRCQAFIDLDECLRMILKDTLEYLQTTDKKIDSTTRETYLFYKAEK